MCLLEYINKLYSYCRREGKKLLQDFLYLTCMYTWLLFCFLKPKLSPQHRCILLSSTWKDQRMLWIARQPSSENNGSYTMQNEKYVASFFITLEAWKIKQRWKLLQWYMDGISHHILKISFLFYCSPARNKVHRLHLVLCYISNTHKTSANSVS